MTTPCETANCVLNRGHRARDNTPCISSTGQLLVLCDDDRARMATLVKNLPPDKRDEVMRIAGDLIADEYEDGGSLHGIGD